MVVAFACNPPRGEGYLETSTGESIGTTSSAGETSPMSDATSTSLSTADESDTTSASESSTTFIREHDGGTGTVECDLWAQDCRDGEKCNPWAKDGSVWDATRCVPIAPDPAAPGEPCAVLESIASGLDDCEKGSMCYYVDEATLAGTCIAFCRGSEANPTCDDPNDVCVLPADSVLPLCRPSCDPLTQDCGADWTCLPLIDEFVCEVDASGRAGAYGDSCAFANVCDPGLFCANADGVPSCAAPGCCSLFCDLTLADPDAQCPGVEQGQHCLPWYEVGQAPDGHDDVGACLLPI